MTRIFVATLFALSFAGVAFAGGGDRSCGAWHANHAAVEQTEVTETAQADETRSITESEELVSEADNRKKIIIGETETLTELASVE